MKAKDQKLSGEIEEDSAKAASKWHQKTVRLSIIYLLFGLLGLLFITLTKSPNGGPVTILSFLLLAFVFSMSLATLVIQAASAVLFKRPVAVYKLLYSAFLIGLGIVFLTGLQTLRQLQPVDIILVLLFEILLNFYFLRRF